jgi:hypothetical protein
MAGWDFRVFRGRPGFELMSPIWMIHVLWSAALNATI